MQPIDLYILGISIIPIIFKTKKPAIPWQQYQLHPSTQHEFDRWFGSGRRMNAAAVTGTAGLVVLDFDDLTGYVQWLSWAVGQGGIVRQVALETYRVRTPRGMHVYTFIDETPRTTHVHWCQLDREPKCNHCYRCDEKKRVNCIGCESCTVDRQGDKTDHCRHCTACDVKATGGYVLIPPSVHPSGVSYRVALEGTIVKVDGLQELLPDVVPSPSAEGEGQGEGNPGVYKVSDLWPGSLIERIRAAVSLLEYFPHAKPTSGDGRWYRTRCPFHDDKDPSLWIDARRGICGCYSGCTPKPLDVVNVHARLNKISDREAIRVLSERL